MVGWGGKKQLNIWFPDCKAVYRTNDARNNWKVQIVQIFERIVLKPELLNY